jgi:hypothetical protein
MSFSLYFSEACTNFYKYLKAVAIFELIYSIFGKRKIFNSHWAESTVDGPVALGTWLVFGPGWLGESSVVPGMRYAHGTIDAHTTRMLDGGAGQRDGVLRGEGSDVCASLAVVMLELERGRREWSLTGRTWA